MNIQYNISLLPYNTFGIDVACRRFVLIDSDMEITYLFNNDFFDKKYLILGGGSNLLFTKDFEGTIFKMQTKGIEKIDENNDFVFLEVAAGEIWDDFVYFCQKYSYYGVENLVGIPGLVGSCPVQNIGAYGVEVKDVIHCVKGINVQTGQAFEMYNSDCGFTYRSSIFKTSLKNQCLVTHVVFRLSKNENYKLEYKALKDYLDTNELPVSLENVAKSVIAIRNSKLPKIGEIGSAGSFFKNPIISQSHFELLFENYPDLTHFKIGENQVKLAAGQLIEFAGWKGVQKGNVGVFPLQALVLVNYGKANGKEVLSLSKQIQLDVYRQFKILLETEVNII